MRRFERQGGSAVISGRAGAEGLVCERWLQHMEAEPEREAIVHWVAGEEPFRWTWGALGRAAACYAEYLRAAGVRKGDVCALVLRHHKEFYPLYMAVSAVGALPSVLAYPNSRLHPDKFRHGLEGMARRSGLTWILTEEDLDSAIRPLVSREGSTLRGIVFPLTWANPAKTADFTPPAGVLPTNPCLLQHSSGTTGLQKAVMLSHRALLEHVSSYAEAIQASRADKIVSWLPLYHDMGLIAAFYLPLTLGINLVQLDPFEWVAAPALLLEAISHERGTLCWLPNFAYNLLADRVSFQDLQGIRLDSMRMFVNCSEPIRKHSHDRFYARYRESGLRREALAGCYAMAETTFAVTQSVPGRETTCIFVDPDQLAKGAVAVVPEGKPGARSCVSSGRLISGCEAKIVDATGEPVKPAQVGEITVRSRSLFDGYRNDPAKTADVRRDGWYFTGDYGFEWRGEYYIIGRKKDIIIMAGKNIYPEDVEDAVGQLVGVIPGRAVAFGLNNDISGTESVCVVVESHVSSKEARAQADLRSRIVKAGMAIDVTIARVYLAPPRWLIKSSSGKPSRRANSDRAVAELSYS